jgi:hypothetical protein
MVERIKRIIFYSPQKFIEIHISVSINKAALGHCLPPHSFTYYLCYLQATTVGLSSWKYLLSDPSQKDLFPHSNPSADVGLYSSAVENRILLVFL